MERQVSIVTHSVPLVLGADGNCLPSTLVLANADNDPDGDLEIVVGTVSGSLLVFKGLSHSAPQRFCHNLGTVTAICVGDARDSGRNVIIAFCAEGTAYVFDLDPIRGGEGSPTLVPHSTHTVPCNIVAATITRLGEGDKSYVICGTADRAVYVYGLYPPMEVLRHVWDRNLQGPARVVSSVHEPGHGTVALVGLTGGQYVIINGAMRQYNYRAPSAEAPRPAAAPATRRGTGAPAGTGPAADSDESKAASAVPLAHGDTSVIGGLRLHKPGSPRAKSRRLPGGTTGTFAVASWQGDLTVYEKTPSDRDHVGRKKWSAKVPGQVTCLRCARGLGEGGSDLLVAVGTDGRTLVADADGNRVRFSLRRSVRAFNCGRLRLPSGRVSFCFLYATNDNKVAVVTDIEKFVLPLPVPSMLTALAGTKPEAAARSLALAAWLNRDPHAEAEEKGGDAADSGAGLGEHCVARAARALLYNHGRQHRVRKVGPGSPASSELSEAGSGAGGGVSAAGAGAGDRAVGDGGVATPLALAGVGHGHVGRKFQLLRMYRDRLRALAGHTAEG